MSKNRQGDGFRVKETRSAFPRRRAPKPFYLNIKEKGAIEGLGPTEHRGRSVVLRMPQSEAPPAVGPAFESGVDKIKGFTAHPQHCPDLSLSHFHPVLPGSSI